jgi:hypothetical protein
MRLAVAVELDHTIRLWHEAGRPEGKWDRNATQDDEGLRILRGWTMLGDDLLRSYQPWQVAVAAGLYKQAAEMAHAAEAANPGLDLHKGIEYFSLGFSLLLQGLYDEGGHYILLAIEEDRAAGSKAEDTFAAKKLRHEFLMHIPRHLEQAAVVCETAGGLTQFDRSFLRGLIDQMCFDPNTRHYRPTWALWLYAAVRKARDVTGWTAICGARRLEVLQNMSFLFEAAIKEKEGLGKCTLQRVVEYLTQTRPRYGPHEVLLNWSRFTNYGLQGSQFPTADDAPTAPQSVQFGLGQQQEFCCKALLTVGLVRNMTHHEMDLSSALLTTQYQWVHDRVLAALLISW